MFTYLFILSCICLLLFRINFLCISGGNRTRACRSSCNLYFCNGCGDIERRNAASASSKCGLSLRAGHFMQIHTISSMTHCWRLLKCSLESTMSKSSKRNARGVSTLHGHTNVLESRNKHTYSVAIVSGHAEPHGVELHIGRVE